MFDLNEIFYILKWWSAIFIVGLAFLPLTLRIFGNFIDRGYLFGKVLGLGIISYALLLVGMAKLVPFSFSSTILVLWVFAMVNLYIYKKSPKIKLPIKLLVFEEVIFLLGIVFWTYIRAHEPSINGLEKFMDFGFVNSILRSSYQPAPDMWFTPLPINYYYFGHLTTAFLTRLSTLPSYATYNLMISTIFAFCLSLSFSLGINLLSLAKGITRKFFVGGILTGALVSLSGNLHTIYAFFQSYSVDNPVPFWQLPFLPESFPNAYWYPNATRFIVYTIHEFPIYSFVVSDLHGHVVDIIYALLFIAVAFVVFTTEKINKYLLVLVAFILSLMYMTNIWDSVIYMLLFSTAILAKNFIARKTKRIDLKPIIASVKPIVTVIIIFAVFTLPFNAFFEPFASGVGILCAPDFLVKMRSLGPLIFEPDHCQKSYWWELLVLYGFFYFFALSFIFYIAKKAKNIKVGANDIFVFVLIFVSTILIILPELIYVKDIYPQHYRANTMFKLVYQAFIMLSISSGYIIVRIIKDTRNIYFFIVSAILLGLVFLYPYFAIKSYYGDLKNFQGIDGISYLETRRPDDYKAINWINRNIKGQPVIAEAQGDSYTDYARISANTGLPTILGWTVHEWLWRGTYDIPAPRIEEVRMLYESPIANDAKTIIDRYNVEYIYVGDLEREKYPQLNEEKFKQLGSVVFESGNTRLYKLK